MDAISDCGICKQGCKIAERNHCEIAVLGQIDSQPIVSGKLFIDSLILN